MKSIGVFLMMYWIIACFAQNSDNQFRRPLKEVLNEIQKQYNVSIRFTDDLVKDKWVTYAGWKLRPDVEKTLTNILAAEDISFAKEGDKKYKLQAYQYH